MFCMEMIDVCRKNAEIKGGNTRFSRKITVISRKCSTFATERSPLRAMLMQLWQYQ